MNTILEVKNLVKRYPGITAVDEIGFSIREGTCVGLLGPNGAGKTTTIEIIEGIIAPTSGEVLYKGKPRDRRFLEEIGIQFQATALLNFLSVKESLHTFANLYRRPVDLREVISSCYLEDILDQRNDKISGGQKQRLMLAIALSNDPELVFLDEPTTGLDPQARRHLWEIVENIKKKKKTVVLTTHYMEEAQRLCDKILLMDHGKIILEGEPEKLLKQHCSGVTITLSRDGSEERIEQVLERNDLEVIEKSIVETQNHIEFQTTDVNRCLRGLMEAGIDLSGISLRSMNLEDLFLQRTGRHLRQ